MFSKRCSIALDIGNRFTKVIFGKREKDLIYIYSCGKCDIPCKLSADLSSRRLLAESILCMIAKTGLKPRDILIGIDGRNTFTRNVRLPNIKIKYLHQAAEYEFKKYLPLSTEEYIISEKINKVSKDSANMDVLVAAVPKAIVSFYLDIVNMLGLPVKLIDIFANSLVEFFNINDVHENPLILIDIGHSHTEIVLIEDGRLYFQRSLNIGCGDLDILNCDDAGFESRAPLDDLINNISSVIDFYISNNPYKNVDSIYIHGGGASIEGIKGYIGNMIDVDILSFDGKGCNVMDESKSIDDYGIFLNCISLLCRA